MNKLYCARCKMVYTPRNSGGWSVFCRTFCAAARSEAFQDLKFHSLRSGSQGPQKLDSPDTNTVNV